MRKVAASAAAVTIQREVICIQLYSSMDIHPVVVVGTQAPNTGTRVPGTRVPGVGTYPRFGSITHLYAVSTRRLFWTQKQILPNTTFDLLV